MIDILLFQLSQKKPIFVAHKVHNRNRMEPSTCLDTWKRRLHCHDASYVHSVFADVARRLPESKVSTKSLALMTWAFAMLGVDISSLDVGPVGSVPADLSRSKPLERAPEQPCHHCGGHYNLFLDGNASVNHQLLYSREVAGWLQMGEFTASN